MSNTFLQTIQKVSGSHLRALMLLSIAALLLCLPLGMDAKKQRSRSKRSPTTTTTANKPVQRTIILTNKGFNIYLYPSGYVKAEVWFIYVHNFEGTWAQYWRTIGNGNRQYYYEINFAGQSHYWVPGGRYLYNGYSNFINYGDGERVEWGYLD